MKPTETVKGGRTYLAHFNEGRFYLIKTTDRLGALSYPSLCVEAGTKPEFDTLVEKFLETV